jgi:hypothetical protein
MQFQGFGLSVVKGIESNGRFKATGMGDESGSVAAGVYVSLENAQKYGVRLTNYKDVRSECTLKISDRIIGEFLLMPGKSYTIHSVPGESGIFTFYTVGSEQGQAIGLVSGNSLNGLIDVVFTPELIVEQPKIVRGGSSVFGSRGGSDIGGGFSEGSTGISGAIGQNFVPAEDIQHLDYLNQVRLMLRLVGIDRADTARPLNLQQTGYPKLIQ